MNEALNPMKQCKRGGLFMTEWGTSDNSGNGALNFPEADKWSDWAGKEHIAMCNWSLNNKAESSGAIKPGVVGADPGSLAKSGEHVLNNLIKKFNVEHYGKSGSVGKYDLKCDE
eukprot:g17316.t1